MHRSAVLLPCALVAVAAGVLAAPAPFPKPPKAWTIGWDKPVDPVGDCRFERNGDKLAIAVPGRNHGLEVRDGRSNAPRLLRDVEGDFALAVKVSGDFQQADLADAGVLRRAGLILTDGRNTVVLVRGAHRLHSGWTSCDTSVEFNRCTGEKSIQSTTGPPLKRPAYLRLERRGDDLTFLVSQDGKKWVLAAMESFKFPHTIEMPQKVKVGVVVEATAAGDFKAEFDQMRLTRPPDRSRLDWINLHLGRSAR